MIERNETQAYAGVPNSALPMWPFWKLPAGQLKEISDPTELEGFEGDGIWLGLGGPATKIAKRLIPKLTNLRFLVIEGPTIPQSILDRIANVRALERLHLTNIRTDNLEFLSKLESLEFLCIESLSRTTDISAITKCENLVALALGVNIPDLEAFNSRPLARLECIVLHGSSESQPALFASLTPLQGLKKLKYLCLPSCRANDKSLDLTNQLPELRSVVVGKQSWWNAESIDALQRKNIQFSTLI